MKKIKAITSGLLAAAMALTMTACDETPATSTSDGGVAPTTSTAVQTTETTTTFARNDAVAEAAGTLVDKLDNPDLEVTKKIKWMAWWDIDETTAAAELYKSAYGVPEYEADGKTPNVDGEIFDYTSVSYSERYDKLGSAIAADDSPDLFPFEALDFPYGVLKGRYQPIDEIIDLSTSKWEASMDLMNQFVLNGRYYCAFYEISMNNLMYYRTSIINEIGVDDPRELFEKGEWTWDAFLDMARKFQASGEGRYVIDGYNPENDFVISTGTPMVGNDNGVIVSNLYDPAIERVEENMLKVLQQEDLRYPRHELNGWNVNPKYWADGNILFYADGGTWVWESTISKYAKKNGWSDDEVKVVPFPKDPQADAYYATMKQDSLMWCKGSKNEEGVKAWIDCCATAAQDPDVKEASIQQAIENYNWSRDNLEFIYSLTTLDGSSPLKFLIDFKGGLGTVSDGSGCENPVQSLTNLVYLTGESYVQLRETHNPAISAAIDDINAAIAKS
jgi:multiple sugar transport system substrate-binding protein